MTAVELASLPDDSHIGRTIFQNALDSFIRPEIASRRAAGTLPDGITIRRFQILLHPERSPQVLLNGEVGGQVQVRLTREMKAGEAVNTDDISEVKSYVPLPANRDVPHITAFLHREGWSVAFNFAYRHPERLDHLAAGSDFAATTREAFAVGRIGVALDNAYSAAELFAKAELLSCYPTIEDAIKARSHKAVATPYNLWALLKNTDARFVRLLYRLQELRGAGRYLDKEVSFKDDEPSILFETLAEMEAHVTAVAEGQPATDEPQRFRVIAKREIIAGQLLTQQDFTIRPSKRT